jgi:lipopolysaccharide/colanic/teichoic acid biosynthesis glycosyltransferase
VSGWLRFRIGIDRIAAGMLLVAVGPFLGALGVLVRRGDGGPSFIGVTRVGRDGREFRMWKLRTMRADESDGRAAGPGLAGDDDERVTAVGRQLRAYYLDELPQLLNVVLGQMSLLGPRPETPEFVELTDPRWRAVLATPPGMAGPTQLVVSDWERMQIAASPDGSTYASEVVPVKLAIDLWYVEKSSPRIDALVAISLARRLLPGAGSSALKRLVWDEVPEARTAV